MDGGEGHRHRIVGSNDDPLWDRMWNVAKFTTFGMYTGGCTFMKCGDPRVMIFETDKLCACEISSFQKTM